MKIQNALDIKKGAKKKNNTLWNLSQPLQFLPNKEKDLEWAAWNLDWLEHNGLRQLRGNSRRLMKNYKLAAGIIDKSDYIVEENNEMKDIVQQLSTDTGMEALELKFYPIIPNIVNTLTAEFAKRQKRISFRAVDEYTQNEILDKKRADIEDTLVKLAEVKMINAMIEQGADPEDPEMQKALQEKMSPENMKSMPEIQELYSKDYEVLAEKWASKLHVADEHRFDMDELEEEAFRDKLIADREFWHMRMLEDDYEVELWNPVLTFYHKSPTARYISDGSYVGKVEMMTHTDVVDTYGWLMNEDQMKSLEYYQTTTGGGYAIGGYQNDGSFYDGTKSHAWNTGAPSLAYRQLTSMRDNFTHNGNDVVEWVLSESEDGNNLGIANSNMFRVTTAYWKSQRRVGHLTKVLDNGKVETAIISEEYDITDKAVYNTSLIKNKTSQNLIAGEHIEWVWINHVWGGVKIGPNSPTYTGMRTDGITDPIYLGINQNQIKPLKFQFKGDNTLWGCKLPVEGRVFTERNTRSHSMVDSLKPHQIGFNIANNQIQDILIDEIGTVVLLDQNGLPKHSLGEDWGKGNLGKAYVAMKDFGILPLDTSLENTEGATNFQHYQQLDLSQTARLMSRMQLAQFFKQQAYEQVGVNPQRMGQAIGQSVTATEVEQTQVGSQAQTETHFIEHCDQLMPKVHSMRTNLAQWYQSTNPSIRLQNMTSADERINFEMNGTELLLRDLNVYSTTKYNHRQLLEKMQNLAVNNNTTGASIYDLFEIEAADSVGTMTSALKKIEQKTNKAKAEERAHAEKLQQMTLEQQEKEKAMTLEHEALESEKDRRKDILVAEIKASGFGAMQDQNNNGQNDFVDNMTKLKQTEQYQETVDLQGEKVSDNRTQHADKIALKKEDNNLKREKMQTDLKVAETNKNQYDVPKKAKEKKDSKS